MNTILDVMKLVEKYQQAQVLIAANELAIIPLLESGAKTPGEISERLGVSERGIERLLVALADLGLVKTTKRNSSAHATKFKPTKLALQCFGEEGQIRNWIAHQGTLFRLWADLAKSVREDKPLLRNTHDIDVKSYTKGLMEQYILSEKKLQRITDLRGKIKMLDVGGGAGHYTIMAALNNPMLRGTILDKPEVAKIASEIVSKFHLEGKVTVIEGDALKSEWPKGNDVILVSNILHGRSDLEAKQLLLNAYSSLKAGGRAIINEWSKDSSQEANLFDINMFICTERGRVWSVGELLGLLRESGFTKFKHRKFDRTHRVIEAWKLTK